VEGDVPGTDVRGRAKVSIHAPRVEGDAEHYKDKIAVFLFQSTPPGWRATSRKKRASSQKIGFNPRPPGGGRPPIARGAFGRGEFQSTPPGWRATARQSPTYCPAMFQSTPPGWRATPVYFSNEIWLGVFQSTPPGWRATKRFQPTI